MSNTIKLNLSEDWTVVVIGAYHSHSNDDFYAITCQMVGITSTKT
jgi:hypothetical protein